MKTLSYRGLTGKERKIRRRNRASRFYQDQLIAEYYHETDQDTPEHRRIPIRHRSEFLPSVHDAERSAMHIGNTQMELPLRSKEPFMQPLKRRIVWPLLNKIKSIYPSKRATQKKYKRNQAIKFARATHVQPATVYSTSSNRGKGKEWQPVHLSPKIWTTRTRWQRTLSSFSFGEFAYGCALGGAAAAFVLMLISFVMD